MSLSFSHKKITISVAHWIPSEKLDFFFFYFLSEKNNNKLCWEWGLVLEYWLSFGHIDKDKLIKIGPTHGVFIS